MKCSIERYLVNNVLLLESSLIILTGTGWLFRRFRLAWEQRKGINIWFLENFKTYDKTAQSLAVLVFQFRQVRQILINIARLRNPKHLRREWVIWDQSRLVWIIWDMYLLTEETGHNFPNEKDHLVSAVHQVGSVQRDLNGKFVFWHPAQMHSHNCTFTFT